MNYFTFSIEKVTDFTANIIVDIAVHVPFIMSALTGNATINPNHVIQPDQTQVITHSASIHASNNPPIVGSSTISVNQTYHVLQLQGRKTTEAASSTSKTIILLHSQGKLFSKEDAITAAHNLGYANGFDFPVDQRFTVQEGPSKLTGAGASWFIAGPDYHASKSFCPKYGGDFSSLINLSFEMNEISGNINIDTTCDPVIYD